MEKICIGEVVKPQGIKGEVKVKPYSADLDNMIVQKSVFVGGEQYSVKSARLDKGMVFYTLNGVDRNKAEELRGSMLEVEEGNASALEEGEYYIKDLIGCEVLVGKRNLGVVQEIDSYGAADVYTVVGKDSTGKAVVVRFPFLKRIIINVDIAKKQITLDAQGFEEVCVYED